MNIGAICDRISFLKEDIAEQKKSLTYLEDELIKMIDDPSKLEGTISKNTDHIEVTITKKLTRKLDLEAYQAMDLPDNAQFVDFKPSINIKRMRAVEQLEPSIVEACVTIKPAKTAVKIVEVV